MRAGLPLDHVALLDSVLRSRRARLPLDAKCPTE